MGKMFHRFNKPARSSQSFAVSRACLGRWPASRSGRLTFSITVIVGSRLKNWNTIPRLRRRYSVNSASPARWSASPFTCTSPVVGVSSPPIRCSSVLFPHPLGPVTATNSSAAISIDTSSSASTPPAYARVTRSSRIIGLLFLHASCLLPIVPRPTASAQPSASIPARIKIIAESSDWIVIDKPPLLQVHPSKPSDAATLWHLLRRLLCFELANGGQVSIINRLDRETSGLVLVAKSRAAARHFCEHMERGRIAKQYMALVHGWPAADRFAIDAPLLRQGIHRPSRIYLKQCVHPAGAHARTRFEVIRRFTRAAAGPFALVRAFPETGRMHQIRVHLAHAGHPVVGDKIYGSSEDHYLTFIETGWTPALEEALLLRRHALHSALLDIPDDSLRWEAPLPPDIARFAAETP